MQLPYPRWYDPLFALHKLSIFSPWPTANTEDKKLHLVLLYTRTIFLRYNTMPSYVTRYSSLPQWSEAMCVKTLYIHVRLKTEKASPRGTQLTTQRYETRLDSNWTKVFHFIFRSRHLSWNEWFIIHCFHL